MQGYELLGGVGALLFESGRWLCMACGQVRLSARCALPGILRGFRCMGPRMCAWNCPVGLLNRCPFPALTCCSLTIKQAYTSTRFALCLNCFPMHSVNGLHFQTSVLEAGMHLLSPASSPREKWPELSFLCAQGPVCWGALAVVSVIPLWWRSGSVLGWSNNSKYFSNVCVGENSKYALPVDF